MIANIDLRPSLLAELPGMKDGNYNLSTAGEEELQRIASTIIQPYLDRKLTILVDEKRYPAKVDRLVRNNNLFTVWLSSDTINYKPGENPVKIEYRLLFDETGNAHLNLAYLYLSDATGEALKNLFDFSAPAQQYSFESASPAWELSRQDGQP